MTAKPISTTPRAGQTLRAVIFDLDGVLIHSAPLHRLAFEQVLEPFGIRDFDYSRYAGWRTKDVIEQVFADADCIVSSEVIAAVSAEKSRLAREFMARSSPVAKGCVDTLQALSGRYTIALASSGSRESVQAFLETTRTADFFRSVLTGGDVCHAKPDPEIYTRTFEQLGLKGRECLVAEDAVAGVIAARGAGASVVGIAGTCDPDALCGAGAMHVLGELADLPAWIKGVYEQ